MSRHRVFSRHAGTVGLSVIRRVKADLLAADERAQEQKDELARQRARVADLVFQYLEENPEVNGGQL